MLIEGSEPISDSKVGFEKQTNIFNLKDIIISQAFTNAERLEALAKLKRQTQLPTFKIAVEGLLKQLSGMKELHLQVELINTIGKSQQQELIRPLQTLLVRDKKNLHADVIEEIHEAIAELSHA